MNLEDDLTAAPNPDNFLVEQTETGFNFLQKNEQGDFIKLAWLSELGFAPELDEQNQPRMRFEFQIDARHPTKLNVVRYLSAEKFFQLADQLRSLMNGSDS